MVFSHFLHGEANKVVYFIDNQVEKKSNFFEKFIYKRTAKIP